MAAAPMAANRVRVLERKLAIVRQQLEVALWIVPCICGPLDDRADLLGLIVSDVVAQWRRHVPEPGERSELVGPRGFCDLYVRRVQWTIDAEGDEAHRPEFSPPPGEPFDEPRYMAQVWAAHLHQLRQGRVELR
jgi:hypothetical protein